MKAKVSKMHAIDESNMKVTSKVGDKTPDTSFG